MPTTTSQAATRAAERAVRPAADTASSRVTISNETAKAAKEMDLPENAEIIVRTSKGDEVEIPTPVQKMLLQTLEAVAGNGKVTVGPLPEVLTSTQAAKLIGVSRPTMVKLAEQGEVDFYRAGTHMRFYLDDVVALRQRREEDRRKAFAELRALDAQYLDLFDT